MTSALTSRRKDKKNIKDAVGNEVEEYGDVKSADQLVESSGNFVERCSGLDVFTPDLDSGVLLHDFQQLVVFEWFQVQGHELQNDF